MNLVVASDKKTYLTDSVIGYLKKKDHKVTLLGDSVKKNGKWMEIGKEAAKKMITSKVNQSVLFCWSGTGIYMAANKVRCIRAAL